MPFIVSQVIDACRWVGALLVLAVHGTNMFVSLADIMSARHSAPVYAWWFVVSFELGHQAVVGFFVISGYLVGGAVITHLRRQHDFLREYFIHRFARIYVVLIPALLLTALLDSSGRILFPSSGVYDWAIFKGHSAPRIFLGNLLNLQEILTSFFGTNGPLWSLACEFWYYITFPLLLLPMMRNYSFWQRLAGFALGVVLCGAFVTLSYWFRFGYILWGMGAFAILPRRPLITSRWLALALYSLTVIPIRLLVRGPLLAAHPLLQDAADIVTAALFVNVLVSLRFGPEEGWAIFRSKLHKKFADFSFSLYSTHLPILIFVRAATEQLVGVSWPQQLATPAHWMALAAAMILSVGTGYLFSCHTEAHTGAARRYLRAIFSRFIGNESLSSLHRVDQKSHR